jgi:succinate dehydrogenase / fumarate reductase, cytochrome b subunit
MSTSKSVDFFSKNEFLIRRLHSLTGLIPVGAYMVVHLVVNASILNGAGSFQANVHKIHALGSLLPLVEWSFIFIPIIFHALVGVWIVKSGKSNVGQYKHLANWRYSMQRWTGMIAIVFIFMHVFHLHGWFHGEWWKTTVAEPLGMANFKAYNAASTLASALSGFVWPVFYVVGVVACVFHLANGIWTMGITWGVWISPKSQRTASIVCTIGGGILLVIGLSALVGVKKIDIDEAKAVEDSMYEVMEKAGLVIPDAEKRSE